MDTLVRLAVEGLAHDGRGIARLAPGDGDGQAARGQVVFVSRALPGQEVLCRIIRRRARFCEAQCLEVLREAPHAHDPLCPHQAICGGCPLQTMPHAEQLRTKSALARDALVRLGGFSPDSVDQVWHDPVPAPALREFRNKMTFAFGADAAGSLTLGLREALGSRVVAVPGCVLMPAPAQAIRHAAEELAKASGLAPWQPGATETLRSGLRRSHGRRHGPRGGNGFWRFVTLRLGHTADDDAPRWWVLCLTSPGSARERAMVRHMGQSLVTAFPQLAAFVHEERQADDMLAQGQRRVLCLDSTGASHAGAARMYLPLGGRRFALDAACFFQVNSHGAERLAQLAREMCVPPVRGSGSLADLFCGVGAPGQLLAENFSHVLGMEADPRSVACARENAAAAGLAKASYVTGDAAHLHKRLRGRDWFSRQGLTAVLVDPPRSGLSPRLAMELLRLQPQLVVHISCNPVTFARDARLLARAYTLERLHGVDMFPHSMHLESCALWRRREQ